MARISQSALCTGLRTALAKGASAGSFYVKVDDANDALCSQDATRQRITASNMKLFTTATALTRLGADTTLATGLYRDGRIENGVLKGSLFLVGAGDPSLGSPSFYDTYTGLGANLFSLTAQLRAAGVTRVTGRLYADDTVFDRVRGVEDSNYGTSVYIGPLSGLTFNEGYTDSSARHFSVDPAKTAATKLVASMRGAGIKIARIPALGALPTGRNVKRVGSVRSPAIAELIDETNVESNNFFAETLLKLVGARFGARGSTLEGTKVVRSFVETLGSSVHNVDGSGLTRANTATAENVAALLQGMLDSVDEDPWVQSLALAGREGTVADRMRGTAAQDHCRTKTGTITGVSALSGYCFNESGKRMVFSILMNGVTNIYDARNEQDRMAALIARY